MSSIKQYIFPSCCCPHNNHENTTKEETTDDETEKKLKSLIQEPAQDFMPARRTKTSSTPNLGTLPMMKKEDLA